MAQIWQAVFIIIFVLIVAVIPYAIFYYESDDGMAVQGIGKRHCEAVKYTLCVVGTARITYLRLVIITYTFMIIQSSL